MQEVMRTFSELAQGLGITLSLFALTLVIAIPVGFLGSYASMSRNRFGRGLFNVYVAVMRGTPLILQVVFVYFGLNLMFTNIGSPIRLDRFASALLAFSLNYIAYFSEIFRGGIQSINRGQREAAAVLGLTPRQTMFRIIVPQVFKIVLPSIGNEVINLVKDTALVSMIALGDLLKYAYSASMREANVMPLVVAAVFYLAINAVVSVVLRQIEKRMSYYRF